MFYLSEYLEAHREEYYQRLKAISAEGDWDGWIAFFLQAIVAQAGANSARVAAIQRLYEEMKLAIQEATHSQYTVHVLDAIFSKPIFRSSDLTAQLQRQFGIHEKTTPGLLRQMRDAGILLRATPGAAVANNLVYANGGPGIAVGLGDPRPTTDVLLTNNTIFANGSWGIAVGSGVVPSTRRVSGTDG